MNRGVAAAGLALVLGAGVALGACGGGTDGEGGQTLGRTTTSVVRTATVTVAETTPVLTQSDVPGTGAVVTTEENATEDSQTAFRPFANNSPWNTNALSSAVDRNSEAKMRQARERLDVLPDGNTKVVEHNDGLFVNIDEWTVPVVDETNGVTTRVVCRQPPLLPPKADYCGDGWSVSTLLIPPDVNPHPEYDGWFTVLNRAQGVGYDLWRARRSKDGTTISYQFMRKWDLNGAGFLVPNTVSARGSGLPLFGGLIWPEEIRAGRIDHALAMSVPGPAQGSYVQPASATDGIGERTSLPEGARIRLRDGVTFRSIENRFTDPRCDDPLYGLRTGRRDILCKRYRFPSRTNRRAAEALITALRRYGAIIVDRSRVPTLYAKFNYDWSQVLRNGAGDLLDSTGRAFPRSTTGRKHRGTPLLRGNEIQGLRLTDFEVVRLPPSHPFPDLDATTVAPLNGVTGQQVVSAPRTAATRTTSTTATRNGQQRFQPGGGGG